MPTDLTDGLVYTPLDTVTVPVDTDARNAASIAAAGVGFQALADRTNNLANRVGGPDGSLEHRYLDPDGVGSTRQRVRQISSFSMFGLRSQALTNTEPWNLGIFGTAPTQGWVLTTQEDLARLVFDFGSFLPQDAIVKRVRALIAPGIARTVQTTIPGDNGRMWMGLHRNDADFDAGPPATYGMGGPLDAVEDDGTTNIQALDTGTITRSIDKTLAPGSLILVVTAGNDAGTNKDDVAALEITYTDFGPQNF